MPRQTFEVEVPEGTHLSMSRQVDGGFSALLRDDRTKDVVTHAVLLTPDSIDDNSGFATSDDDGSAWAPRRSESADALAELAANVLILVAVEAVRAATPHVKTWWKNTGGPRLRSTKDRTRTRVAELRRRRRSESDLDLVQSSAFADEGADWSDDGGVLPAPVDPAMTAAEAQQRLAAAVLAKAYADEQIRLLSTAQIVEADESDDLSNLLRELTPERLEAAAQSVLAENPRALEQYFESIFERNLRALGGADQSIELIARPMSTEMPRQGDE